jgi:hypothetical protein
VLIVILVPVALLLHLTVPAQPLAVKVAVSLLHKLVLSLATTGAAGLSPGVIVTIFDTSLVPHALLQKALYVPVLFTVILVPVEPLLQITVALQPFAVNVATSLLQSLSLLLEIVGLVGLGMK